MNEIFQIYLLVLKEFCKLKLMSFNFYKKSILYINIEKLFNFLSFALSFTQFFLSLYLISNNFMLNKF